MSVDMGNTKGTEQPAGKSGIGIGPVEGIGGKRTGRHKRPFQSGEVGRGPRRLLIQVRARSDTRRSSRRGHGARDIPGGVEGGKSFGGRSAERTWLVGIMKNKIGDFFRKASRETSFTDLGFYQREEDERFVSKGLSRGEWIHELGPSEWTPNPGEVLDNQAFWRTFHAVREASEGH